MMVDIDNNFDVLVIQVSGSVLCLVTCLYIYQTVKGNQRKKDVIVDNNERQRQIKKKLKEYDQKINRKNKQEKIIQTIKNNTNLEENKCDDNEFKLILINNENKQCNVIIENFYDFNFIMNEFEYMGKTENRSIIVNYNDIRYDFQEFITELIRERKIRLVCK
jgi:uncharacterized Zn finger protein (UPF0148 family)